MQPLRSLAQDAGMIINLRLPRSQYIAHASLYDNNSYLRLLNRLLLMELGATKLYLSPSPFIPLKNAEQFALDHKSQAQTLSTMIIHNRGIPDCEKFSFPSEISLLASKLGRHLPHNIARRTDLVSCLQLEKTLHRRYYQTLSQAPGRDRSTLNEQLRSIKNHIDILQNIR